jgi:hypothetical protein
MQVLSCTSAAVLVAICGLLLRSLALVSGARSPNFEASDPNIESNSVSSELMPIIVLIAILLTVPAITALILVIFSHSKFKKLREGAKQKASELKKQAKITKKRMIHDFSSKEEDFFPCEHQRRLQSSVSPQEVAVQLSPDASSSVDISTVESIPFAAHSASLVPGRPLNAFSLHTSKPGARNDCSTQSECLEIETDFHFCDFEMTGTSENQKEPAPQSSFSV